ncbi:hypothetical protein KY284_013367 [Solanum tuberosum]|nr:hypothetical protein KY284_013367 [Solanum tuberosum]
MERFGCFGQLRFPAKFWKQMNNKSPCKDYLRRSLWERMLYYADTRNDVPWCVVGDFNVITNNEETLGGIPYNMR